MANFFKDYHAEVKAKREAEEIAKAKRIEYNKGQVVHIDPMYDGERNGKRYFVDYLGDGCILLAKTKKDALDGYGYIYDESIIIRK